MSMNRFAWLLNLIFIAGLLVAFMVSSSSNDQKDDVLWARFVGRSGRDIAYDVALLDDGIVMVGWTSSVQNSSDQNIMIVKLSKRGELLWHKELGSVGTEGANCVEKTRDGGFIVGVISGSQDGEIPAQFGNQDVWLLKFDSQGKLQWKRCYGSQGYESIFDVVEDDGYLFVGYTTRHGSEDVWFVKTDLAGEVLWERTFSLSKWDCGFALDKSDGYYVAGMSNDISVNSSADMWVMKLSKSGELLWQKRFVGSDWDQASDVVATDDGGCVVLGTSWSKEMATLGGSDFVLIKLDANGEEVYRRNFGGSRDDIAQKMFKLEDGYLLVGTTWSDDVPNVVRKGGSDYLVMRIDRDGQLVWAQNVGALMDEVAYSVSCDTESYFVAGVSYSHFFGLRSRSHGEGDALLLRVRLKQ